MSENLSLNASFNAKAFVIENNVSRVDKFLLKGIKLTALSNGNITIGVSRDPNTLTLKKTTNL
jgi:hypothetical protein